MSEAAPEVTPDESEAVPEDESSDEEAEAAAE